MIQSHEEIRREIGRKGEDKSYSGNIRKIIKKRRKEMGKKKNKKENLDRNVKRKSCCLKERTADLYSILFLLLLLLFCCL